MSFTKVTSAGIGSTELVTLDSLEVINNASIGGVLTYEDVTNVDSIGIITARAGVLVGSGITLSKDGDVFFTGIATGNGSGLTALNASNIGSGTVPTARLGSGTASSSTFLRGDSTFAAVTTTTINNNADNRLITGSGTADTLEGESTFTYDGSATVTLANATPQIRLTDTDDSKNFDMVVNGGNGFFSANSSGMNMIFEVTGSERLRIDSSGRVLIGTTTEGSSSSDDLTIATSGTTGITIRSGTSNNGNIEFSDGTSGQDEYRGVVQYAHSDNSMRFYTDAAERARIDSSGNLKIGATANRDLGGLSAQRLHIEGTDGGGSGIGVVNNQNSTGFPSLRFAKSRGTSVGSNTVVANNDPLGGIIFCGADGTDMASVAAEIKCEVGGTPGSNDMPGELIFRTTADGASTASDRMKIYANGAISIGADDNARSFTLFNPVSSDTILRIQNDVNNEDTGLEIVNVGASGTRTFRMGGYIQANNTDTQFASSEAFRFYVDTPGGTNEALRLQTNKRVVTPQVYSTAGSSMRDVQIESDGTLAALSSITAAKINIADVTDISWLYNLKPKTFNFRKKTTDAKTGENTYLDEAETEKAYGLLAEDVETVNKDLCFYNKDSEGNDVLAGVYYKTMVVPLLKAVQELKAENTALKARVTTLEGS